MIVAASVGLPNLLGGHAELFLDQHWSIEVGGGVGLLPPLLTVGTFVFDLLCIHPFRDGNGRVSRLASALLLQQHGFQVGRFVSLERLTERQKED